MSENTVVNPDMLAKLNVDKTLEWVKIAVGVAKKLGEALNEVNGKLDNETLKKILEKLNVGLAFVDKILQNKALMDFFLSLINMFVKKEASKENVEKLVTQFVLGNLVN